MANIQKILDSLKPYVIGFRYVDGTPLVDAVFKEGWTVPEDKLVKRVKGNEEMNYYMVYSDVDGVGVDELFEYVERVIKLNQEREKKHDLLRKKVNELKELFQKHSLVKLANLKFVFNEDLVPSLDEFDIEKEFTETLSESVEPIVETIEEPNTETIQTAPFLDEHGNPIELTEEEKEMLEEEARAERNRQMSKKRNPTAKSKIELPPKSKIQLALANDEYGPECDCGPDEACSKCIDSKGF
jgi:hypothetical protein